MLKISTSGDLALDRQLRDFDKRLRTLENSPQSSPAASGSAPIFAQAPQPTQASLRVQDVAATSVVVANGLEFDGADGFVVSADGDAARIDRAATATVPASVGSAAAAGSATDAANSDHVHAGVTSLAAAGNLVGVSAAQGAITLTVKVPMLLADPGSPAAGDAWYRTDTDQFCVYTGSAIKRSAAFT